MMRLVQVDPAFVPTETFKIDLFMDHINILSKGLFLANRLIPLASQGLNVTSESFKLKIDKLNYLHHADMIFGASPQVKHYI